MSWSALLLASVLVVGSGGGPAPGGSGPLPASPMAPPDTLQPPLLLVPGWSDEVRELGTLRSRFLESGWDPGRVHALEFSNPVGSNLEHAEEIARAVDSLRSSAGGGPVDVVAHSMGGLALRVYLARNGGAAVRRVVFLATPHRGTVAAHLAWGEGGREMEPGSPFLDSLNARPPVPAGVEALSVRTPLDLRVLPGQSVILPETEGIRNVEVCCPTHAGLLDDYETFRLVREFLAGRPT